MEADHSLGILLVAAATVEAAKPDTVHLRRINIGSVARLCDLGAIGSDNDSLVAIDLFGVAEVSDGHVANSSCCIV